MQPKAYSYIRFSSPEQAQGAQAIYYVDEFRGASRPVSVAHRRMFEAEASIRLQKTSLPKRGATFPLKKAPVRAGVGLHHTPHRVG
jgi:hypothetical protein